MLVRVEKLQRIQKKLRLVEEYLAYHPEADGDLAQQGAAIIISEIEDDADDIIKSLIAFSSASSESPDSPPTLEETYHQQ